MRRAVRTAAWVLLFAALGAVAASWFTPRPELEPDDAVATAEGAFSAVGFDAAVTKPVVRSSHVPDGEEAVDVWVVYLEIDGDEVETRVLVDAGQLVYVDDRIGADRSGRLLDDEQFLAIADYRNDVTLDRWVRRNGFATMLRSWSPAVCFVIAKRSQRWET